MQHLLPVLTQEKFNNQRDVVLNERRQRYENQPYGMIWEYLSEALYPAGHPYAHTTIGSPADLTAATLDDVHAFFREYYAPANAVLTIVGDFDREPTKALIRKYFAGVAPGRRAAAPAASMPTLPEVKHITKTDEVKLPRVYLAWHTPALYARGDAELDLLAAALSTGKSSRLYRPLVYEQKVAKDVHAYQVSQKLSSFFVVQATAAPGRTLAEVAQALLVQLRQALAAPLTDAELARALNAYRKGFYARIESVAERAMTLSNYFHLTGSAGYLAEDLARYTGATAATVHAEAKQWLDPTRYVRIDIVPGSTSAGVPDAVDQAGGAE
jgi:predicted Zn-dependent peptidase